MDNSTLPKIYALFVGIDKYPEEPLEGPVNDARSFQDQLANSLGDRIISEILINEEATYEKLIKAFTHFDKATTADQCLFFFAGHGTRLKAPEPFWTLESDKQNDAFVCFFDKENPRRDLIDKELSYLIWKASAEKNILFNVIIDACHAKGLYRGGYKVKERYFTSTAHREVPLSEYLGSKHYIKNGAFRPLPYRQVLLAAAQEHQTAKEEFNFQEGCSRGIFSYWLQKCLRVAQGLITYNDLMNRVVIGVRNEAYAQSPDLLATLSKDKHLFFLGNNGQATPEQMLIAWNDKLGWFVNRGSLHGMIVDPTDQPTKIGTLGTKEVFQVIEVFPDVAKLRNVTTLDKGKIYPANLRSSPTPKFAVAVAEDGDPSDTTLLYRRLKMTPSQLFRLVATYEGPKYLLHAKNDSYYLTPGDINPTAEEFKNNLPEGRPLFARVMGYDWKHIPLFINRMEAVLKWRNLLALQNPGSRMAEDGIQVTLERTTAPIRKDEENLLEVINWRSSPTLAYHEHNGGWHPPGFRLTIENTTDQRLFVSTLFLDADYGIDNAYMDNKSIPSKASTKMIYMDENNTEPQNIIPVPLDEHYREWGMKSIYVYLKIIVSIIPFNTDNFLQKGLPQERLPQRSNSMRSKKSDAPLLPEDWKTIDVCLEVFHPQNR